MKKIMNICAAVAMLFASATTANAQEVDYAAGYNFITLKGGAQATLTYFDFKDLLTPQYGVAVGRYFNDKVGARLDISGYENKGGFCVTRFPFLKEDKGYKFNACTADLDLLMNMTNILNPNRVSHAFNWNLLAGFGVNYTWDNSEFEAVTEPMHYYVGQRLCEDKHASFNGRLGTQLEYNLSKNVSIMLEADANYKNDQYNLKFNDQCDWQIQGFIGLTYKFGVKTKKHVAPVAETNVEDYAQNSKTEAGNAAPVVEKPAPAPKPVVKPAEKPVVKEEPLKETFFYQIRESDPDPETLLNKIAEWCKKYPAKKITVSGYADKGTGTVAINKKYALARAQKVANQLKAKGVPAAQMEVNSYGDTVQPFAENDRNRCVIVVGE